MQWNQYQSLSPNAKVEQFTAKLHFKKMLHSHFGQKNTHLLFNFSASIVDTIIDDMFFHPDEHGGISYVKALNLFKRNMGNTDYTVIIKNPMQFHLVIDYFGAGLSFHQVNNVIQTTKKHTNLTTIGFINEIGVANYARMVCAINLQALSTIINDNKLWAFSLANDA